MITGLERSSYLPVHIVISNFIADYQNENSAIAPEAMLDMNATNAQLASHGIILHSRNESAEYQSASYDEAHGWPNDDNRSLFDALLTCLRFHNDLVQRAYAALAVHGILGRTCNVLHLRNEEDALRHWGHMNSLTRDQFESVIRGKYIDLANKYLDKQVPVLVLTYRTHGNPVIEDMMQAGYRCITLEKDTASGREYNGVIDLLSAELACNGTLVSCGGSSFSYTIFARITAHRPASLKRFVTIDLNAINREQVLEFVNNKCFKRSIL